MQSAAPASSPWTTRFALAVTLLAAAAAAPSGQTHGAAQGAPVWGVAVRDAARGTTESQLRTLARQGVTSLVVVGATPEQLRRTAAQAKRAGLNVIAPRAKAPKRPCPRSLGQLRTCAAVASTAVGAVRLARLSLVDYVVVNVRTARQLRMLAGTKTSRSRIVAVLPLSPTAEGRSAWQAAVAYAAADPTLDLAVAAPARTTPQLRSYLAELPTTRTTAAATPAPTALRVAGSTGTTVTLSWAAVAGAQSYRIYVGDLRSVDVTSTTATIAGLTCGRTYSFSVDAVSTAGRSAPASVTASTAACTGGTTGGGGGGGGGGGTVADSTPPSTPGSISSSGSTATSITVTWAAATDNIGVTGYARFRNGGQVSSGPGTTYTFVGLVCNTTYTLGVEALDAAGNRSGRRSGTFTTAACGGVADTQPPTVPQGQVLTAGQTSVTMSWNAATDNVGVAGYRTFKNGVVDGTTTLLTYTFSGLACGTTYTFALEAYDAAANASNRTLATGSATTLVCSTPTPPPAPGTPPPAGTTGNLWVDTTGGTCQRQATRGAYVDSESCTWNAAYQAAQTGDVIVVRGGSYGDIDLGPNKASITAPGVSFVPAGGETVVVRDLENGFLTGGASNINFYGPVTARTFRSDGGSNILVDGWRVDCGGCDNVQVFHLENATNVTVRNSDVSDNNNNSLMWIQGTNLTFENNVIHDAGLPAGSGAHTECMYAWDVTNLTLKRNHFYHCSVMDVFITGSSVASGGYIENNVFEKPWENTGIISNSAYAFHFRTGGSPSPDPSNWDFRYNTFVGPLSISTGENPVGAGGMRVIGNVFLSGAPCGHANTTYAYNAFASGGCGSNAVTFGLTTLLAGFLSTGDPGDYALRSTSVLVGRGDPSSYPSVDRSGTGRPVGGTPDLGAYESTG